MDEVQVATAIRWHAIVLGYVRRAQRRYPEWRAEDVLSHLDDTMYGRYLADVLGTAPTGADMQWVIDQLEEYKQSACRR